MTVLALALALTHGGLLADGYVHTASSTVRLINASELELVAGGVLSARAASEDALDAMSLSQLQAERSMLESQSRSVVAPIILLASGATAWIVGSVLAAFVFELGLGAAAAAVLLYIGGTALVIAGTVLLITTLVGNGKNAARIRRIDQRIAEMQQPGLPVGGGSDVPPPPPPPPPAPPSTQNLWLPSSGEQLVLATF
jgi:hypothetical protein